MKKLFCWCIFWFLCFSFSSFTLAENEAGKNQVSTEIGQQENATNNLSKSSQFSSELGDRTILIGNKVNLPSNTSFGQSSLIIGNQALVEGVYNDDVMVIGSDVTINAKIKGDLSVIGSNVDIKPSTQISGNLYYLASDIQVEKGATIGGKIEPWQTTQIFASKQPHTLITSGLFLYAGLLILGLFLIIIIPRLTQKTISKLIKKPWASLGWGLLTLFFVPALIFLFLITVIGLPVALVLSLLYMVALVLAYVYIAMAIGILIFKLFGSKLASKWNYAWGLLLGLVILFFVHKIPFVGGWLIFIALLLGLGSLMMGVFQKAEDRM